MKAGQNKNTGSKGAGLLPGCLLTTPGRRRAPHSNSILQRGSSNRSRRLGQLAPGLRRLVAAIGYGKKGEAKQP